MNNISIKCLKSEKIESGSCHGQFLINSLKPGQGITIGNQLRRVLLNDLGGVAISAVRIAGISHEFSTIPGVREDILEILLNLKGIVLKSKTQTPQVGRLKIQGPAVVTADLIQLPANVEIVNSNHYIMTISTANILEIEFQFEYGTGYKIASQFTIDLFTLLLENKTSNESNRLESKTNSISIEPYTNIAIEELQLSVRAYNCLKKAQINTIGDLLQYSPEKLQELKNFGRKSADEVFSTLKNKLGIILK
jgi:DNA-directed RNA polymerase subunit alpha